MKHTLIFLIGGPILGSGVCFLVLAPAVSLLAGEGLAVFGLPMLVSYVVTLPIALVIGLVPAALAFIVDAKLVKYSVRRRWLWCAAFGYLVGFVPLAPSFFGHFVHGAYLLAFGLVGAIPAGVCSWWAGRVR